MQIKNRVAEIIYPRITKVPPTIAADVGLTVRSVCLINADGTIRNLRHHELLRLIDILHPYRTLT